MSIMILGMSTVQRIDIKYLGELYNINEYKKFCPTKWKFYIQRLVDDCVLLFF